MTDPFSSFSLLPRQQTTKCEISRCDPEARASAFPYRISHTNVKRVKANNSRILAAVFASFTFMPSLRAISPNDLLALLPLVEAFANKSLDDIAAKRRDIAGEKFSPTALDEAFQKQAAKLLEEIESRRKKE